MAKFKIGDKVRIVQLTDVDAELGDPDRVIKTNERLQELGWLPGPRIGDEGVVDEIWACDYYTVSAIFDGDVDMPGESMSFVDDDLEVIN